MIKIIQLKILFQKKFNQNFADKFPNAKINNYSNYLETFSSNKIWKIDFTDKSGSKSIAWYMSDGTWKMTQTELKTINDLSPEAKDAFTSSIYGSAKVEGIYKTERDSISNSLYTISFKYPYLESKDEMHYSFINDDGLFLNTYAKSEYDAVSIVNLPKKHFDFILKKYKDAEIRGYINNSGMHEYFILHEDKIKFVLLEWSSSRGLWKETRYELDIDFVLPDNVIKYMDRVAPDFVYTNIYYIETELVNKYFLLYKPKEEGHYISEDIPSIS